MPAGSPVRLQHEALAVRYVEQAGVLYGWGLRCFLLAAPLLAGIVAPLLAIQLWIAASRDGLGPTWRGFRQSAIRALAPQSIFVYGCGLVLFAVAPYFLIFHTMQIERAWLEVSVLIVRLSLSALLILFGWVTTVGTLSLLSKPTQC
jgi:hypothetical protein